MKVSITSVPAAVRGLAGCGAPTVSKDDLENTGGRQRIAHRAACRAFAALRPLYPREPGLAIMFLGARTLAGRRAERLIRRARYTVPASVDGSTAFPDVDCAACVQSLIRDGIAFGLQLPAPIVADINAFAVANQCFARDRQDRGFLPADIAQANADRAHDVLAGYYFEAVEDCSAISALRDDPDASRPSPLLRHVGQSAQWNRTRLWWSFPADRLSDADLHDASQDKFHFDMNGWGTLKFFFYLTPVTEANRPAPLHSRHAQAAPTAPSADTDGPGVRQMNSSAPTARTRS